MQCATPKRVQPLHITASSPQEGSVELHAIRRKHLVIDYRARALVGVELDVATNKVVLRFETWPILRQHWVIERLYLERAVEALHRGIVVAVSRSRETLRQAHAVGRIPECLSSVDTAAVTVEHCSRSQASA